MFTNILVFTFSAVFISSTLGYSVIPGQNLALTATQRAKLEQFRSSVLESLEDDYEKSDTYLLGYLLSNKWLLFSAQQKLKIAKHWKRAQNITELAKSDFDPYMLQRFPVILGGRDKYGCPLLQWDFGSWDVADYILNANLFFRDSVSRLLKHYTQILAKMELVNQNSFPKCHQFRTIVSAKHFTATHFSDVNSISALIGMAKIFSYFPNMQYQIDYVDVPESFLPIVELLGTSIYDFEFAKLRVHLGTEEEWKTSLNSVIDSRQRIPILGEYASWSGAGEVVCA